MNRSPSGSSLSMEPSSNIQFFYVVRTIDEHEDLPKLSKNFVKATFDCLQKTYGFLTPKFWKETRFVKSPYQEYTDLLASKSVSAAKVITETADQT